MSAFRTRYGSQVTRKWTTTKWYAAKRGLEYTLPRELAEELIVGSCHYCGVKAQNIKETADTLKCGSRTQRGLNGIDRIDSSLGYVPGNVISSCSTCNYAKGELTVEEFKEWLQRAYTHMNRSSS